MPSFEERVALLEEQIVTTRLTPEEWLERAEQDLANGYEAGAPALREDGP
jgi:hypothetical protein